MKEMKITEVPVYCPKCNWQGTVIDCEPDIDGDGGLGCPRCYEDGVETVVKESH